MKVSVVIPALNESSAIVNCVKSAIRAGADEIIVVDGGSTDDTREQAKSAGARVTSAAKGRATQQNAGATLATGEVVLFLHADCMIGRKCISQIRDAMQSSKFDFGCFRQRIVAMGAKYRALEFGNDLRARILRLPYGDQGIFVRKKLFEDIGGFPEYRLMEDLIMIDRLRRSKESIMLQGPVEVSPRRWQKNGVAFQTLKNLLFAFAWRLGVHPDLLAKYYPVHKHIAPRSPRSKTESTTPG